LFCEKEDHVRILEQAGWDVRHDCALLSSKGYSTRAARDLIDLIADTADAEPVTVFCIHDADAAGTMIAQTLQEATRARGRRRIEIVDIGLQPWDAIGEMKLPEEDVKYDKEQPVAAYVLARDDGRAWKTWLQEHRVELNAMPPGQLIRWLDAAVEAHGALKVVPPADIARRELRDVIEATIRDEERERVLREAEQAIRAAADKRIAEIAPLFPSAADLVADVQREVTVRRDQHWRDVLGKIAVSLIRRGG
jgi:hypothetical protein